MRSLPFIVLLLAGPQGGTAPFHVLDLARVRELYHLTDAAGDRIWPGFDTRRIPVAINHADKSELLVGHPNPPPEFRRLEEHDVGGVPVFVRAGCTRYGPQGGGWAVDLGGERTAYVSTLRRSKDTEGWLTLLLHECFHVYQRRYREPAEGKRGELPEDDAEYSAMLGLESRILAAALDAEDPDDARDLAEMFVAVRHERRRGLSEDVIRNESEQEWNEGTAKYAEARLLQVLSAELSLEPTLTRDPGYHGFRDAEARLRRYLRGIVPREGMAITFSHAQYEIGMAQALLLDRLRPDWKGEMRGRGAAQFTLLERECPLDAAREAKLVLEARDRFGYRSLLAGQTRILEKRLAKIRGYLRTPGRRYRVYHGDLPGSFKWKPQGPVYRVPQSLRRDSERSTLWVGGIARFEKQGMVFSSKKVPVLFRRDYLEWIDPSPAKDESDLVIESVRAENGIYHGLRVRTDGFDLTAPRARVRITPTVVTIRPVAAR